MHANFHYISLILIKDFFPLCKTNDQKRNNYELAVPKIVASQRRISEASEAALPPKQIQFSVLRSETDKKIPLQFHGKAPQRKQGKKWEIRCRSVYFSVREKIEEKNVDQLHAYKAIKQVISPLHTINALTFQGNITLYSQQNRCFSFTFCGKSYILKTGNWQGSEKNPLQRLFLKDKVLRS